MNFKTTLRTALPIVALLALTSVAYAAVQRFQPDTNHTRILFVASTVLFDVEDRKSVV